MSSAIDSYYRNTLPRIGLGIPLMSCLFYKTFQENKPLYLFNLIPTKNSNYNTRTTDKIALFHTKHNVFKNYFFPSTVIEWNKPDPNLRTAASLRKESSKRICWRFDFNCHNSKGIKYLTRFNLALSRFREHKLKHI